MTVLVQMYSYKGGSGRTVATANISKILADKGYKVLVIDMDAESAGLSYVFRVEEQKGRIATQDILEDCYSEPDGRRSINLRTRLLSKDKDQFLEAWQKKLHYPISENLWFIPARYSQLNRMPYADTDKLDNFLWRLEVCLNIVGIGAADFVFFDSPSGLQDWARRLFDQSILVVFFRWSRQFTHGTVRFLEERIARFTKNGAVSDIRQEERISRPKGILIVPNAVPDVQEKDSDLLEKKKDYLALITSNIGLIKAKIFERDGVDYQIVFHESGIPECNTLKWDEKILAGRDGLTESETRTLSAYNEVAQRLIGFSRHA